MNFFKGLINGILIGLIMWVGIISCSQKAFSEERPEEPPETAIVNQKDEPFTAHKDNYFIFGGSDDQVKYQMSFKYAMFWPFENTIYLAYTQTALWALYDKSSPFKNYDHNPEAFFTYGDLSFIKTGIEHKSNGRDGIENRSMNDYYGEIQLQSDTQYSFGAGFKAWVYFNVADDNKDIKKYYGDWSGNIFFVSRNKGKFLDNEKIYIRFSERWFEGGIQLRFITSKIQPRFYIQLFHGYCESLLDYNKKETALRVGFILN